MLKVGRNDPCPCGSGKKFKKCHFGREGDLLQERGEENTTASGREIVGLPGMEEGRCREVLDGLDILGLTGSRTKIRFIDLDAYVGLGLSGAAGQERGSRRAGGVIVNPLKTQAIDPEHIYVALSRDAGESTLIHEVAHVLNYLKGSSPLPGYTTPLSYDLSIPVEHLEHTMEFAGWLKFLAEKFGVTLDADDRIVAYLHEHGMLLRDEEVRQGDGLWLRSRSEKLLSFLSARSGEIDALICELPGYIGSRKGQD